MGQGVGRSRHSGRGDETNPGGRAVLTNRYRASRGIYSQRPRWHTCTGCRTYSRHTEAITLSNVRIGTIPPPARVAKDNDYLISNRGVHEGSSSTRVVRNISDQGGSIPSASNDSRTRGNRPIGTCSTTVSRGRAIASPQHPCWWRLPTTPHPCTG